MQYTVLVIDDQWSMQELARIVLRSAGYRVLLASDGATGLSLARTEHPDVAVVDMQMPGLDGLHILQDLHQDGRTADIPVILITGDASSDSLETGLRAGASGCLQKPFHPPALLLTVNRLLKRGEMPIAV